MSDLLKLYEETASASLEDAYSLPFPVYYDKEIFRLEADKIFHKEWIFICSEADLPEVGDYFAFDLAGESIEIIRGTDHQLRAISNNCRHRGTQLLDHGHGNISKTITCPYHAWVYDTQGTFIGAPFTGNIKVDKTTHCLSNFNLDTWLGLVFINLSQDPPSLSERFSGIESFCDIYQPEKFDIAIKGEQEYWSANWKLAMENAMESYHLFKVHKETLEQYTPTKEAYYVAGSANWTLTGGKIKDSSGAISKWLRGDYPEAYNHYLLFSLPPAFVGVMTYDSFSWISILPSGSETTSIRSGALTSKHYDSQDPQGQEFTAAFFAEDKWICERVQKGMYSKHGCGGKLVEMERVIVDFHQYLASRLFGSTPNKYFDNSMNTVFNKSAT